jgi:radical SAM protein with 4Fe4S-binding SPASM domain
VVVFLTKLTLRRIGNFAKIYLSYHLSRISKKPIQWGVPMTISIEPTTACNLRCPECPSGLRAFTRDTGNLKTDFFRKVADSMAPDLMYMIFYFQGEPYINPQFLDMVSYAAEKKIYTITSTNAHFLNDENARKTVESGLSRILISIDGTTQEVYQNYRKEGKLENVIRGTENLISWKKKLNSKTPHIVFQFLVVRPNEHQIQEVYHLAESLGVDEVKLKTAQIYDYKDGNELIPTIKKYSRYVPDGQGRFRLKYKLVNQCWKLWHACVITWDGLVVPCCFDKDATHQMGDMKSQNFKDIWQGTSYQNFRRQLLKGRDKIDICSNCSEGCKVFH